MVASTRSWLLPGAYRWLMWCIATVSLLYGVLVSVRILVPERLAWLPPIVDVLMITGLHLGLLVLLVQRARRPSIERPVWWRLAVGGGFLALAFVVSITLASIPATREWAAIPACWIVLAALPFIYSGLVRWNRFGTSIADPNDILNGLSAVLAVVAVLNVWIEITAGPLTLLPWWQLQPLLAHVAGSTVVLGTALALPFIGAMGRDLRTWLIVLAFAAATAGSALALVEAADGIGWGAIAQPILIVCLALAAVLRSRRAAPRPADPTSATIGAFVVIIASTAVLIVSAISGVVGLGTWCAAAAVVGAGGRTAVNVRELALLAVSRQEALTDELTGLANRRAVLRRVDELCTQDHPMALALLDVDKFKEVNDALGHAAGDDLLRLVAGRLGSALRAGDLLGRLGGDEFAVVVQLDPDFPPAEAALALGARLRERLEAPFPVEGMLIHASASIGVATSAAGVDRPAQLLRRADVAMYDAKRSGAGVAHYDPDRHADSSRHLVLVEELRSALTEGQLVLHHQPQLAVDDGRVIGVECLVRWAHPERGLLPPGVFLPLAEVHGLMGRLTEVVLAQAVAQAAEWRHRGLDLPVSVNLSASNLLDSSLPARLAELLAAHEVPPSLLVLEVTETVLLTDPDRSLAVVAALADLGVRVSIDDFGTGYSSLAYLRDLPVHELKLDRTFTADLCTDPRTQAIIASTIDLAHRLGLRVVAEGVEDSETLEHLRSLGCDISQGFLHSPALPAQQLEEWLIELPRTAPVG